MRGDEGDVLILTSVRRQDRHALCLQKHSEGKVKLWGSWVVSALFGFDQQMGWLTRVRLGFACIQGLLQINRPWPANMRLRSAPSVENNLRVTSVG